MTVFNPDTRVAICCYEGDQHQVVQSFGLYAHHHCPIVVLSPEDSKVNIAHPGVDITNLSAGKRAYIGQDSLDREREHLKLLLTFPEKYFFINDADSFCLDAEFPNYLYAEPDHVWSNVQPDGIPEHQPHFPPSWPHVAFQPPYFLSRKTIEAMLAVADRITASPMMPFIDFYMVQLTMTAGLSWKNFLSGVSVCIAPQEGPLDAERAGGYERGLKIGLAHVRRGANMIHSVKNPLGARLVMQEYQRYLDSRARS